MWQVSGRHKGGRTKVKVKFDDHVTYFEFLGDRICSASHSMLEAMGVKIKLVLEMYEILF